MSEKTIFLRSVLAWSSLFRDAEALMIMSYKSTLANCVRRAVFPLYGARAIASRAVDEMSGAGSVLGSGGTDAALLSGHPAGWPQNRVTSRLGAAVWEVFPAHVALLDRDGMVVSVNRAWRQFGLRGGGSTTTGLGSNYVEVCDRAAAEGEPEAEQAAGLVRAALAGRDPGRRLDYLCEGLDGPRWFRLQAVPISGQHSGAVVMHTDITADRQHQQEWQRRALHDPLTGLPNRTLLSGRLEHAVAMAGRDPRSLAVLFADLDAFKTINDTLGHDVGDQVLCEAAHRMAAGVRDADTIGRWGGDEFVVIAEQLDTARTADDLARRIVASLDAPIAVGSGQLTLTVSVGIAYLDAHQSAAQLVDAADHALRDRRLGRSSRPGGGGAVTLPKLERRPQPGMAWAGTYALPNSTRSPALARTLVREALAGFPQETIDGAELLVSELVTNAVLHAQTMLTLTIELTPPSLTVTVEDCSPDHPQPRDAHATAASGRGLSLVDTLARSWGWNTTPTGKRVWFAL